MDIKILNGRDEVCAKEVGYTILDAINNTTRFTCSIGYQSRVKTPDLIKVVNVRLKESKPYCGSHPSSCDNRVGFDTKPRKSKVLEGSDWVEFNDTINDILDRLNLSANVKTVICILRKDTRRRIHYGEHIDSFGNPEWNMDEADNYYVDYCGSIAPDSSYPVGTPGLYERNVYVQVR